MGAKMTMVSRVRAGVPQVVASIWAALVVISALTLATAPPASAGAQYFSQEKGFDACQTPSTSAMQTWWTSSPYFNYYVYIGGSNKANCGGATVNSSWISTVLSENWQLIFTWVGPQMPYGTCQTHNTYNTYVSLNTSTAYTQGYNEAVAAFNELTSLGVNTAGIPIAYDLEWYNGGSSCRAAASSFMKGWATYFTISPTQWPGVYGSSCASYLNDFASDGSPPWFIWGGDGSTGIKTESIACIPSTNWTSHQRHKQYAGGHNETYGGVTISMDSDCSDGPVYGTYGNTQDGACT